MYKESQSRSFKDKLKDYNPFSSSLELFNNDIKNIMGEIRGADRSLRRIFTSDNNPEEILKQCRALFKRREYMQCVMLLDLFREKLYNASKIQITLNETINLNYKNFFISQLKGKEKQDLIKFRDKMNEKKAKANLANFERMVKNAGVTDWFRSIFTQRGRALRTWEKIHSQEVAGLKEGLVLMMDQAQNILNNAYSSLKEMSLAISQRNISVYLKQLKNFKEYHKNFDKSFVKFYNEKVKDILSQLVEDKVVPPAASTNAIQESISEDDLNEPSSLKPDSNKLPTKQPKEKSFIDFDEKPKSNPEKRIMDLDDILDANKKLNPKEAKEFYLNQDRIKQARQNLIEKAKLI